MLPSYNFRKRAHRSLKYLLEEELLDHETGAQVAKNIDAKFQALREEERPEKPGKPGRPPRYEIARPGEDPQVCAWRDCDRMRKARSEYCGECHHPHCSEFAADGRVYCCPAHAPLAGMMA